MQFVRMRFLSNTPRETKYAAIFRQNPEPSHSFKSSTEGCGKYTPLLAKGTKRDEERTSKVISHEITSR